jgi:hypothetical protein
LFGEIGAGTVCREESIISNILMEELTAVKAHKRERGNIDLPRFYLFSASFEMKRKTL